MYYIIKGLVRGYYLTFNGNEITKCFSAEEEIFGVEGFLYNRNATYYVECLEDVDCIRISYEVIRDWIASDAQNTALAN
jgi:CRP-like cAMP-binding protein